MYEGSLDQFLREPVGSWRTLLRYYDLWWEHRAVPSGFLLVRYEDLMEDPTAEVATVSQFLGLDLRPVDVAYGVEAAAFDTMRRMEHDGVLDTAALRPGDKSDPDSYKTRRGKVGGYVDYMTPETIESCGPR